MSSVKIAYAASSNLTVTNLNSSPTSSTLVSGWESDTIDNTTNLYVDYLVSAKITVASASLTAGQIAIYIVPQLDDSTYPGGFDGTESQETGPPLDDAGGTASGARLGAIANTDTTNSQVYYFAPFSVAQLFGGVCPAKFVIFITHNTAQNLASSGNQVTIKGVYYTVA